MTRISRSTSTVLVVEDNLEARELFAFALRAAGYEILEADDGVEALAAIKLQAPAVILTDLRMPNMNGLEFARALKAIPEYAAIPIVLITATPISDKWAALAVFHSLFAKPISLDALVEAVDDAVAARGSGQSGEPGHQ